MRIFQDTNGREWQAVVGRESWGGFVAILSMSKGVELPRQARLNARSMEEAHEALTSMADEELRGLLEGSEPFPMG